LDDKKNIRKKRDSKNGKNMTQPITENLDYKYLDKIKHIKFQPIFILGLHRSGTSILYKILSATQSFNIVTAYHLIRYDQLLHNYINDLEEKAKNDLEKFFKKQSQTTREIDQLHITPDMPEEYGFLLAKKDKRSELNNKNLPVFIELCKKIQYISDKNKPILLKNPYDFTNFLFIKKKFPNSKFIFIHRHPLNTLNSQLNAMRKLLKKKNHYMTLLSPGYKKVYDNKILLYYHRILYSHYLPLRLFTAVRKMIKNINYFLKDIEHLKEEDYINIRYEDLCRETNKIINGITSFLDTNPQQSRDYSGFISPRKTIFLRETKMIKNYILKKTGSYLSYCGYI